MTRLLRGRPLARDLEDVFVVGVVDVLELFVVEPPERCAL
jgi:hypothetical protein